MFLVIGYAGDGTTKHSISHFRSVGANFDFLNLGWLADFESFKISSKSEKLWVNIGGQSFYFNKYDSFYVRQYYFDTGNFHRNTASVELLAWINSFLEETPKKVINRPSAGASNCNKLEHTVILKGCGFDVPATHLIGCSDYARQILSDEENLSDKRKSSSKASTTLSGWVSKSCSAVRTRAVVLDDSCHSRLHLVDNVPTQFQECIVGDDVRLHWLCGKMFPILIRTSRFDYRFGEEEIEFCDIKIPKRIANACNRYCSQHDLSFAGFDFKVTPEGNWIALEANPMPGYEYYDRRLDGAIANALLRELDGERELQTAFVGASRRPPLRSPFQ